MDLTVVHTADGYIVSVTAHPSDAPSAHAPLQAGELVSRVDVPEITEDLEIAKIVERMDRIVDDYRVEGAGATAHLVQKTRPSDS
ncbi:hypothetical protein [Nonomuraea wenchangensis]|uniref:Uncharacterized protein n=1 Tax=Nonomuraea wenchangensis TaxID=568860 RepID=A0A1I0IML0_9ACTN|nr:hypothetical protein [Nonomuraea wenchangensis]SET98283.1 hypothetical protein SAMN05421811_10567 [Nonomuraea wenchangensis]